jgi:hypothetical protein
MSIVLAWVLRVLLTSIRLHYFHAREFESEEYAVIKEYKDTLRFCLLKP